MIKTDSSKYFLEKVYSVGAVNYINFIIVVGSYDPVKVCPIDFNEMLKIISNIFFLSEISKTQNS